MILVDEGHHSVAATWQRLFEYFAHAKVVSYTATPVRADGQIVSGRRVYSFGYTRSMMLGFISPIDALFVKPEAMTFTVKKETKTLKLDEVIQLREHDWFSRGIALSEECNAHIVQASLRQLARVKEHGAPRQIIAAACSIRHAEQVANQYRQHGLRTEVLHSHLKDAERTRVEEALRSGTAEVVVQVGILGEGYDLGTLSVAAVFRPYRSLSPYIQFVGRILRLAVPDVPASPGNRVYLVSHVGLNDERWWTDSTMIDEIMETIRQKGFDPSELGLDVDTLRQRVTLAADAQRTLPAYKPIVQPQRRKEAPTAVKPFETPAVRI